MRTVVYQSYRTVDVPRWLQLGMNTVRQWAAMWGYDYEFIDDRLFDYVPAWLREKAGQNICTMTDLAALRLAQEFLAMGYERTVWVDADIVIFAPARLSVDFDQEFTFCHEVWVEADAEGQVKVGHRVNNAISVFTKPRPFLEFYIDACRRIAESKPRLDKLALGTMFLSKLRETMPYRMLPNVGLFSPAVMTDIIHGDGIYLQNHMQNVTSPLAAANLCASFRGKAYLGKVLDDEFFEAVLQKCMQTQGEAVNRFYQGPNPGIVDIVRGR